MDKKKPEFKGTKREALDKILKDKSNVVRVIPQEGYTTKIRTNKVEK